MPAAYSNQEEELGLLPQKHQFNETKAAAVAAEAKYYQMQAGYHSQQYMNPAAYFQQIQHQQAMYNNGNGSHIHKEAEPQQAGGGHPSTSKMAATGGHCSHSPKDSRTSSGEEVVKVEPKVSKNIVHSGAEFHNGHGWSGSGVSAGPQGGYSSVGAPPQPMPAHSKHITPAPNPYHPYAAWMNGQSYGHTAAQFGYPVAGYTNQAGYNSAAYPGSYPVPIKEERGRVEDNSTSPHGAPSIRDMETERAGRRARRNRTCFTKQQMDRLEELLQENRYPDVYRREEIAKELDLKEEVIRVWFKNRRAKAKREQKDRRFMYQTNLTNTAAAAWNGHMTSQAGLVAGANTHYPSSPSGSNNPSPESVYNNNGSNGTGEISKADSPPVTTTTPTDYYQAAFNHIAPTSSAEEAALMSHHQSSATHGSASIVPQSIGDGMQYMMTPSGHSTDYSREVTASPSEDSHSFLSEEVSPENCPSFTDPSHAFQSFAS